VATPLSATRRTAVFTLEGKCAPDLMAAMMVALKKKVATFRD
jgi:hypothetical protein